ncbi:MAG: hypothetical protein M3176_18870 [Chloroflexota bacterium]|nr:hypothetical protein [Chloroflexota bacterium]
MDDSGSNDRDTEDERASQHPVDILIREIIRTRRSVTDDEIARIIERMATVPFDQRLVPVPTKLRGITYQGHILNAREDSCTYHLAKRVIDERQWVSGTTAVQYVADLRRAIRHPSSRLTIYERRGGYIAATLTPTSAAIPVARRASGSLPVLLVAYSVDRGIILSGYQVSDLARTGIPEEPRWLM